MDRLAAEHRRFPVTAEWQEGMPVETAGAKKDG